LDAFLYLWKDLQILHRDIKPGNIVFSKKKKTFMIIDFGESKLVTKDMQHKCTYPFLAENLAGTPKYIDPILLKFHYYNIASRNIQFSF